MTGRERLTAILRRQPADRGAWTILVDGATLGGLPEALRGRWGLDLCAHLGCDAFLLDGWGTPVGFAAPRLEWGPDVREVIRQEGSRRVRDWVTPAGMLTAEWQNGHPVRYPVTTLAEVRSYRAMWERARYLPADDTAAHARLLELLGEQGIYTRFWGPSTIPRLLEYDMGMEAFYYLLNDHPDEVAALIRVMHEKELEAFRILATGPAASITLCENTSTYYISPDVYRRFNGPHVRDFVDAVHAAGRIALVHMCGHVRQLLPLIRDTGLDGAHALTPPQTGDTPWELALDVLGDETVIIGAMPPEVWVAGPLAEIAPALDRLYTPRLRRAHFVLCLFADGVPVPLERFEAVARWMNAHR